MEEEEYANAPCSSLAVETIIRVGTAGGIWGLCAAPSDARKRGLSGLAQASFVASSVGRFGFSCGIISGIYVMTRCGLQKYRRQDDWVNGVIAGAIAGAAVAASGRTHSRRHIIEMAGLVSAFSAAADILRVPWNWTLNTKKNCRGVQLFTCKWLPFSPPKALVFLCHGYGMECSRVMGAQRSLECGVRLACAGYAVFGIDYQGHGQSQGTRCYINKFDNRVNDCYDFFKSVIELKEYKGKAKFLYGESMGGAVALLLHKKYPSFWDGAVLVAPMCKISEKVKPHPVVVNILFKIEDIIPKWKIVPAKDVIDSAFRDPAKRQRMRRNKLIYQEKPRVKTALEMLRTSMSLEDSLHEVALPFLVMHGEADTVTDPEVSRALYDRASSKDKTIKLYPGMWHALTAGESDDNIETVFADIIAWLDKHASNAGFDPEPVYNSNFGIDDCFITR
ncbi:hypothetical protein L6164_010227 [Bauhinia variegata]|uniref:Uncharacterized protein n=1 Tax=Bauhinia variegata TaxID=167791 RepID=A0ACB9PLF1_BAUVA|nr:hypothetical protein L6164_010227 [Bauhinia variegata]